MQLPLAIGFDDLALFETFYPGSNEVVVHALRAPQPPGLWLWGAPGSGRSHLLQATGVAASAPYVALREIDSPLILEGLAERYQTIVLDDLDAVLGRPDWERAIFVLFNELQLRAGVLVVSAASPPARAVVRLPDLASRLGALSVYQLAPLDDEGRVEALQLRAERRGLRDVTRKTIEYLVNRTTRDMRALYRLLDELDAASLRDGRRLTLPFVREWLRRSGAAPAAGANDRNQ